jgi:calcineurin-like phosphoesterase family protein
MNTWFTSDTHFGHFNIIRYCNRPFKTADEMDETIITNWNSLIQPNDEVYHLGDFSFWDANKYLDKLNGKIHIIWGNHDKQARQVKHRFVSYGDLKTIDIENTPIVLCHFSMRVWPKSHHGAYHLFGHSHNTLTPYCKSFDVGVDTHNFFPWSWEEIKQKMNTLTDNYIKKDGVIYT